MRKSPNDPFFKEVKEIIEKFLLTDNERIEPVANFSLSN